MVADAVAEGLIARSGAKTGDADEAVGAEEPLAEWERELLGGDAEKAAVAATGGDAAAEAPGRRGHRCRRRGRRPADAAAEAATEAPAAEAADRGPAAEAEAEAEAAAAAEAEAPAETEAPAAEATDSADAPRPTARTDPAAAGREPAEACDRPTDLPVRSTADTACRAGRDP